MIRGNSSGSVVAEEPAIVKLRALDEGRNLGSERLNLVGTLPVWSRARYGDALVDHELHRAVLIWFLRFRPPGRRDVVE